MDNNKDYYKILGVNKDATQEDINKAYKKLCMKWHPDRWVNSSEEDKKNAEEKFKEVNEANSILSDKRKRQQYDLFGSADGNAFNPFEGVWDHSPFSDFFSAHTEQHRVFRGSDVDIIVDITLRECFEGGKKSITYSYRGPCEKCNGTGAKDGKTETCHYCNGSGRYRNVQTIGGITTITTETSCPYCHGRGTIIKDKCPHCKGEGTINLLNTIEISIPENIPQGGAICLIGRGNYPKGGGVPGNLNVTFNIKKDDNFWRKGKDLCTKLELTLLEAWCGCNKTVKHIDGTEHTIAIKPLTPNGEKYTLPQLGFKYILEGDFDSPGDFVIIIDYIIPKSITEEQKKLLEEFYKLENLK